MECPFSSSLIFYTFVWLCWVFLAAQAFLLFWRAQLPFSHGVRASGCSGFSHGSRCCPGLQGTGLVVRALSCSYLGFTDSANACERADHNTVENSSRDGNTRPPDLPLENSVCSSGSNSENWTWNNRLVPNWERSTSRLYIVTLFI